MTKPLVVVFSLCAAEVSSNVRVELWTCHYGLSLGKRQSEPAAITCEGCLPGMMEQGQPIAWNNSSVYAVGRPGSLTAVGGSPLLLSVATRSM